MQAMMFRGCDVYQVGRHRAKCDGTPGSVEHRSLESGIVNARSSAEQQACARETNAGTLAVIKIDVPSRVSRNVMRNKCSNES